MTDTDKTLLDDLLEGGFVPDAPAPWTAALADLHRAYEDGLTAVRVTPGAMRAVAGAAGGVVRTPGIALERMGERVWVEYPVVAADRLREGWLLLAGHGRVAASLFEDRGDGWAVHHRRWTLFPASGRLTVVAVPGETAEERTAVLELGRGVAALLAVLTSGAAAPILPGPGDANGPAVVGGIGPSGR